MNKITNYLSSELLSKDINNTKIRVNFLTRKIRNRINYFKTYWITGWDVFKL